MSKQSLISGLEDNIRLSREFVALGASLKRLESNKDFLAVIKSGYFEKEAIRLVHLKADPSMQTPERQQSVISQIDAIGNLAGYFRTVVFNADQAERNIAADEQTVEELHNEDN
jgi:hypothetical protein